MSQRPFIQLHLIKKTLPFICLTLIENMWTLHLYLRGMMVSQLSSFGDPLPTCGCIYANAHFIHGF